MSKNLVEARAVALEKAGMSARDLGRARAGRALGWVYRWGWTTPSLIDRFFGNPNRRGLAARLVKKGLLIETACETWGDTRGTPAKFMTLSEAGISEVERTLLDENDLINYQRDPFKHRQSLFKHGFLAQLATLQQLQAGQILDYETESMAATASQAGIKQHDVIWITEKNRIGIEVELSAKWDRKLDMFVTASLKSLGLIRYGTPIPEEKKVSSIILLTDSDAIVKRYASAFKPGNTIPFWSKNKYGKYETNQSLEISDKITGRFMVKKIDLSDRHAS